MTPPTPKKPSSETSSQAVAQAPGLDSPPPVLVDGSQNCVVCGERAVYFTDGVSTPKRGYCKKDLPANVTEEMVEEQQTAP